MFVETMENKRLRSLDKTLLFWPLSYKVVS